MKTVRENELYTPTAFAGGNAVRKILEYSMGDQASADRDTVLDASPQAERRKQPWLKFLTERLF